jgi:Holliday junction DNA helicase RuvB
VGASAIPLQLPHFTVVGATTRSGLLPAPLRDRFGFVAHLDYYSAEELQKVVVRSAGLLDVKISDSAAKQIASRSRGTPRIANRILRRTRDWAEVEGNGFLDDTAAQETLRIYEIDECGLDKVDKAVIRALCTRFSGGPVGVSTLAATIGEEAETIEAVVEPFLVRKGFIMRTPRGRVATEKTYKHLGLMDLYKTQQGLVGRIATNQSGLFDE